MTSVLFQDFLTPEEETDRFSRNVGKELPLYAVQNPRRSQISQNPETYSLIAKYKTFKITVMNFESTVTYERVKNTNSYFRDTKSLEFDPHPKRC